MKVSLKSLLLKYRNYYNENLKINFFKNLCNIVVRRTEQHSTYFDGVVIATERVVVRELRFVVGGSAREHIVT